MIRNWYAGSYRTESKMTDLISTDNQVKVHKQRTRRDFGWTTWCGITGTRYDSLPDGQGMSVEWRAVTCQRCLLAGDRHTPTG